MIFFLFFFSHRQSYTYWLQTLFVYSTPCFRSTFFGRSSISVALFITCLRRLHFTHVAHNKNRRSGIISVVQYEIPMRAEFLVDERQS